MVQIGKSMNIPTTAPFLTLTEPALFHQLAGWKEETQRPSPVGFGAYVERKGPVEELSPRRTPNHAKHTSAAFFIICSIALSRQGLCQDCKGNGIFMALSLEMWGAEQSWRSPGVSATLWLQREAGKHSTACCLFVPEGGSHFSHLVNFLSQPLGKALLAGFLPLYQGPSCFK